MSRVQTPLRGDAVDGSRVVSAAGSGDSQGADADQDNGSAQGTFCAAISSVRLAVDQLGLLVIRQPPRPSDDNMWHFRDVTQHLFSLSQRLLNGLSFSDPVPELPACVLREEDPFMIQFLAVRRTVIELTRQVRQERSEHDDTSMGQLTGVARDLFTVCERISGSLIPADRPPPREGVDLTSYSQDQIQEARALLANAEWPAWPRSSSVFRFADTGCFQKWNWETTQHQKGILCAALELAREDGRFDRLAMLSTQQRAGMKFPVLYSPHDDHMYEYAYEQSAGDRLVYHWCRRHMEHLGQSFLHNRYQNQYQRWLDLPRRMLPSPIARWIRQYGDHAGGDFHEQAALYMSSGLLSLYMNVGYNFCVQKFPHFPQFRQCGRRSERGLLACEKKARKGLEGAFCSYGCEADHCGGSIRVPSPLREDAPLVSREVSADRSGVRHGEDAEQDVLSMHREGARAEAVSAGRSSALRRGRSRSRSRRQTLAFFCTLNACVCIYMCILCAFVHCVFYV